VLVGSNGAGKSTILDAASIAAGIFFAGIDGITGSSIKKSDARNVCYEVGSVLDLQPQFPVSICAEGTVDSQNITWECDLNYEGGRTTIGNAKQLISIASRYQKLVREGDKSVILPVISYYGTGRLWAQKRAKKNDSLRKFNRFNGYIDCLDSQSNEKLMLNWFQKMTLQEAQVGEPLPEFIAVKNAITKCFQLVSGYSDAKSLFNLDTHEIDIQYTKANGSKIRIPMSDLSDGYKNTISMISDIAYRMALLNPQLLDDVLSTPGIILIDEVDLHLHPAWQQRIVNDLCTIFPNVQFVVSTHAPAVINSVDQENLVIVKDNEIIMAPQQVYGRDTNSIMREIMDTAERPIEIKEKFNNFYSALDSNSFEAARNILHELIQKIGENDPEITSCRVRLELESL
jgi:predicted ATP-binding protein involved in virulence